MDPVTRLNAALEGRYRVERQLGEGGMATVYLGYRADVRANVIERPTTGASVPVFSAVLRKLKASYDGRKLLHERTHCRAFMKEINSAGGVLLLESMGAKRLDRLLGGIIADRLGLGEI